MMHRAPASAPSPLLPGHEWAGSSFIIGGFTLSSYLRSKAGRAELSPGGSIQAGTFASRDLVYTAGFYGIDDTGSIKVVFRFATDQGRPQFDDPKGPNYTTVTASNNAVLDVRYDNKDNVRPWDKTLQIRVSRGYLREGDRITIRFGDRSGGSPGFRVQTFAEESFEFKVLVDPFATYTFVELLESPTIAIVAGPPVVWKAVLPTSRPASDAFELGIKVEDQWGNPSVAPEDCVRLKANGPIEGLPECVNFPSGQS